MKCRNCKHGLSRNATITTVGKKSWWNPTISVTCKYCGTRVPCTRKRKRLGNHRSYKLGSRELMVLARSGGKGTWPHPDPSTVIENKGVMN